MTTKKNQPQQGHISINTENILPIIKKWLYSEHEIFMRELISNSYDAINKLHKIATAEKLPQPAAGKIQINLDEPGKKITITDNGLGMDAAEIDRYINQIAFSGAEDFLKKYKDKDEQSQIIGHFGLGFYSAFMVADLVEIESKSYRPEAVAAHWSCDGSTAFTIQESARTEVGTTITLHINADQTEFLSEARLSTLVRKYADFLPVEITVNGQVINNQQPLWLKNPTEVKTEDYLAFYQKLFPYSDEPLFWIHLNVDFPFHLKGLLYFPKLRHEMDSQRGQVKLFCQQVYVSENVKEVVPEFLMLLRGAIDCPDIPLNVSRSYLQSDPYVQKISKHIVKKVADKLSELFRNERNNFEKYWEDINPFIKYGLMNNQDFYDKAKDLVIFRSSLGYYTTVADYLARNLEKSPETVLYASDQAAQVAYIDLYKEQGREVIFLHSMLDVHFIQFLEGKDSKTKFKAVDSDMEDHLIDKENEAKIVDPVDNKTAKDKLQDLFKEALGSEKVTIRTENLKNSSLPAVIMESEQIKRLKSMSMWMKGAPPMFDDLTLLVNTNNPLVQTILKQQQGLGSPEKIQKLCRHVYDLAILAYRPFKGDELQNFIARTNEFLGEALTPPHA